MLRFVVAAACIAFISFPAAAGPITPRPRAAVAAAEAAAAASEQQRNAMLQFAEETAQARGLDREAISAALLQARFSASVKRLIMPPPTGTLKNWAAYRARFVEPQRIAEGVRWWNAHARWLAEAEQVHGVPAEIVVAIVGVETYYGRITGGFRVLDALATLAFDFPTGRSDRSAYFRAELAHFFVLCAREGWDPTAVRGSFAGAMGLPQFMPGSQLEYALDFDGDGHVNLNTSAADVIGSVAHFLVMHGWQRGLPTHYAVTPPPPSAGLVTLLAPDIKPGFTAAEFDQHGARLDEAGQRHEGVLALVELLNGGAAPSYVAGTQNFYTITRYNWSSYYALAVIDLADTLRALRGEQPRRALPRPRVPAAAPLPLPEVPEVPETAAEEVSNPATEAPIQAPTQTPPQTPPQTPAEPRPEPAADPPVPPASAPEPAPTIEPPPPPTEVTEGPLPMSQLQDLSERIERLVLRHEELKRTNALLQRQLNTVANERDHLKSRLAAARTRIESLIERLPDAQQGDGAAAPGGKAGAA
jgi:membrane-bound lytic murein transglycosylase B